MNPRQQIDQPIATCASFLFASVAVATCLKVFSPTLKALECKACTAAFKIICTRAPLPTRVVRAGSPALQP